MFTTLDHLFSVLELSEKIKNDGAVRRGCERVGLPLRSYRAHASSALRALLLGQLGGNQNRKQVSKIRPSVVRDPIPLPFLSCESDTSNLTLSVLTVPPFDPSSARTIVSSTSFLNSRGVRGRYSTCDAQEGSRRSVNRSKYCLSASGTRAPRRRRRRYPHSRPR